MADAGAVIWNLDAESKGFDSKIKKASKDAKDFGKTLDSVDLSGVLNKAGDAIGRIGSALFDVGKKATLAFGAATVAAGAFSVKSAADFEQTRIGLENMLGSADSARSLLKDISKFAAETPFEFPELAQATRQLVAFGFTGKEAFDTMKQLGNVSAAVGAPINDLAYLMGTLRAQGRAFTIDIRQFAQRGIPIYEYLGKVLHKNTQEITAMIEAGQIGFPEVQKAFQLLAGEGGKWGNTMARQSKSLSGLFSTLKDTLGQTGRELIGITQEGDIKEGSVFAKLRDAVDGLTQGLPRLIEQMKSLVSGVVPQLAQWAKTVIGVADSIANYLQPKVSALWNSLNHDLIPALTKLWREVLQPLVPVIGTALVLALGLTIDAITLLSSLLSPLISFLAQNKEVVWGLVAAYVALKAAMLISATIGAVQAAIATLGSSAAAATVSTIGLNATLTSMALPGGAFALVGAAAIAAGIKIKSSILDAVDAVNNAKQSLNDLDRSADDSVRKMQKAAAEARAAGDTAKAAKISRQINEIAGQRATGGPVASGASYLVGERGPEIFTPSTSGNITPNGGGSSHVEYHIGTITISTEADGERWLKKLTRNQEIFDNGLTPSRNAI